jgi:site-specific recombinase XerD
VGRQKMAPTAIPALRPHVAKFLNSLENVETYSPNTVRSYRVDLGQAFGVLTSADPQILRTPLTALNDQELLGACRNALTAWSGAGLSPAARNRKAACLKSFLNWLFERQLIQRDLALQIHMPKVPHRLPHHLSVDEAYALLKTLAESEGPEARYDEALVLLLYGGGLRISEACSLRWSAVDFSTRVIRVLGKGSKERLVALPDRVMTCLRALPRVGDFVFGVEPLSTRRAYDRVRSAGARALLLQPLHPHALRHSFATHLLTSGANLRTLQELLGHSTLQATQRYTHIGIDQLANTLEKFHPHGSGKRSPHAAAKVGKKSRAR